MSQPRALITAKANPGFIRAISVEVRVTKGTTLRLAIQEALAYANRAQIDVWFDWNGQFGLLLSPGEIPAEDYFEAAIQFLQSQQLHHLTTQGNA